MGIKWWLTLSTNWKLQDVQAGLVVIVALLSFVAVFTSARFFWHGSAKRIAKNADVPVSSLLSFTTLGEVLDVVILLKSKLFHSKHFTLAFQCLLVIAFSVCAIFAGPISRYATKVGEKEEPRPNNGLLASRSMSCDTMNDIRWHNITMSLDQANFPYDQLLDFLPDTRSNWAYNVKDWNSTYSANCSTTTEANLTLQAYGGGNNTGIYNIIPGLANIFSQRFLDGNSTEYDSYQQGIQIPARSVYESLIHYSYAELRPDNDGTFLWDNVPTEHLTVHLSMVAMHEVPAFDDGSIATGKIPSAWYAKAECDLTRNRPADEYNFWEAYIDSNVTECGMAQNMNQYFFASSNQPNGDNTSTIILPTGDELFRFFQAFTIGKGVHFPHPVTRDITLRVSTVQVSSLFIAVMSFIALLVIIGLLHCLICRFTYGNLYSRLPETKVDWLLQSLREAESNGGLGARPGHSHSLSSASDDEDHSINGSKEKMPWERARYSLSHAHHTHVPASDGYVSSSSTQIGLGKIQVTRSNHTSSPAPPTLIPGPTATSPAPIPFSSFMSGNNVGYNGYSGYNPLPNPAPYQAASPAPSYTSPLWSPHGNYNQYDERVVSYGMTSAKAQPVVTVAPRNEKGEWEVGVVETRR